MNSLFGYPGTDTLVLTCINAPDGPEIIVCCGSGGVGKTTISAAIGLCGALSGKKTIVLTIDPARRLADALGLKGCSGQVQQVSMEGIPALSGKPRGRLDAMMLDSKRTFDQLVERYAPADLCKKIFANRYYQYLSNNMAGSHEYMAMEKLYEIYRQGVYDLIVLDTPPTRRALDFLEAPQRLMNLLGHNLFSKLFKPYLHASRWGFRLFNVFTSPVLRVVGRVIGKQVLDDLTGFMRLWDDVLFEGFKRRAGEVKRLLSGTSALFLAVATPQRVPMAEAVFLYEKLMENRMPFGGFIVNRVHPFTDEKGIAAGGVGFDGRWGEETLSPALMEKLLADYKSLQRLAQSDEASIRALAEKVGAGVDIMRIPVAEEEIVDLDALYHLGCYLAAV